MIAHAIWATLPRVGIILLEKVIQNLSLIPADIINDTTSTQKPNNHFKFKFIYALVKTSCCTYINTVGEVEWSVTMLKEKKSLGQKKKRQAGLWDIFSLPGFGNLGPCLQGLLQGLITILFLVISCETIGWHTLFRVLNATVQLSSYYRIQTHPAKKGETNLSLTIDIVLTISWGAKCWQQWRTEWYTKVLRSDLSVLSQEGRLRKRKGSLTAWSWPGSIIEALVLTETGMTCATRLLFSLDEHKRFYRTPISQRQDYSVIVMYQDKNRTTLSSCLNTDKNKSIIQTAEMTSYPHPG